MRGGGLAKIAVLVLRHLHSTRQIWALPGLGLGNTMGH